RSRQGLGHHAGARRGLQDAARAKSTRAIRHDLRVWGKVQGHEIAIVGFRQPPREGGYLVVRHGLLLACPLGVASDSVASCRLGGPLFTPRLADLRQPMDLPLSCSIRLILAALGLLVFAAQAVAQETR